MDGLMGFLAAGDGNRVNGKEPGSELLPPSTGPLALILFCPLALILFSYTPRPHLCNIFNLLVLLFVLRETLVKKEAELFMKKESTQP